MYIFLAQAEVAFRHVQQQQQQSSSIPAAGPTTAPTTQEAAVDLAAVIDQFDIAQTITDTPLVSWIILFGAIFGGLTIGKIAQTMLRALGAQLTARGAAVRGTMCNNAAVPASLAIFTLGLNIGLSTLVLSDSLRAFVAQLVEFFWVLSLGWFLFNLVDLIDYGLKHLTARTATRLDDQVVPLVRKTLRIFLDRWGQRGMARGAVVVVFSDGWERGDPSLLSGQMARLHRIAHRVVWVNPHRGKSGYEPVQQGVVAVLPHVDDFVAGHSLATYAELVEVVARA